MVAERRGRAVWVGAVDVAVLPVDWAKFLKQFPRGRHPALLGDWVRKAQAAQPRQPSDAELALLRQVRAAGPDERAALLGGFVRERTEWTHQNNINVGDLEASIEFYSTLFATPPAKVPRQP